MRIWEARLDQIPPAYFDSFMPPSPSRVILTALGCALALLLTSCASLGKRGELKVSINFSGGSGTVQEINQAGRTIRVTPTHHPDRGWDAWWYFRVDGVRPGDLLTIDLEGQHFATPNQAVFSVDNQNWHHTSPGKKAPGRMVYQQIVNASRVWFAWGPPFRVEEAKKVIGEAVRKSYYAKAFTLTRSNEGRPVPALRIDEPGVTGPQRLGLWIQARQHAWESGSSWVAAGLIDWLVSDDPNAAALRRKATINIVPIMDVDNVERGAGGKRQMPHDHNRDWSDNPHWAEVAAAMKSISKMNSVGQLDLFLDLHNPAPLNREPFFFMPPLDQFPPKGRRNHEDFIAAVKSEMTGPIRFDGLTKDNGSSYDPEWQRISSHWVRQQGGDHVVTVCLETPWNTPQSTVQGYRQVGREMGQAIGRFFSVNRR